MIRQRLRIGRPSIGLGAFLPRAARPQWRAAADRTATSRKTTNCLLSRVIDAERRYIGARVAQYSDAP